MRPLVGRLTPGGASRAARRLVPSLRRLCYSLLLSLAAVVLLLPRATVIRSSFMWRKPVSFRGTSLVDMTAIGDLCSRINYGDRSCHEDQLHPPSHDLTDAQVLENMYRGFACLANTIVEPWTQIGAPTRASFRPKGAHARCGDERGARGTGGDGGGRAGEGGLSPFNLTQEEAWREGWRRLADQQLCVLVESMYKAMVSCQHGLRRGLLVGSSSELRARVSAERQCPSGLAVCAIVKNEATYIQEWLAFHLHSGVQHFYLYLNEDDEGTAAALKPFMDAGYVTAEAIAGEGIQVKAYDRCLRKVKAEQRAEWVAFQDVDEFLFLSDHGCLMDFLRPLDDRAAVTVNWRSYSHSGHILPVPRDRLLIEANVHTRADEEGLGLDQHIKSIVRVDRTLSCKQAHFCVYKEGWSAKDEWGNVVSGPFNHFYPHQRRLNMNHYCTRSYADFLMKRFRGRGSVAKAVAGFDHFSQWLASMSRRDTVRDDIKPAVGPVRRILGLD